MVAAPIRIAVWARGASDWVRMAQSVPLLFEYTQPVTAKAKPTRGFAAALAGVATVALHVLFVGWVIQAAGPQQPLPAPSPIRIEVLPAPTFRAEPATQVPPSASILRGSGAETQSPRALPAPPATSSAPGSVRATSPPNAAPPPTSPAHPPVTLSSPVAAVEADEFSPPSSILIDAEHADDHAKHHAAAELGAPDDQTADRANPPATDAIDPGEQAGHAPTPTTDPSIAQGSDRAAAQPRLPASAQGRWRYQVFYGDYVTNNQVATLDYVLNIQGDRYRLHTEGQAVGLLSLFYRGLFTQVSEGTFDAEGFRSERYEERRGDRPPRIVRIESKTDARVVTFEDGRSEITSVLAQDRLSLAAQLAWVAAQRSNGLRDKELTIPLVGVSSVRLLRFQVSPAQILELAGGVRQLTRLRSEDGDGERSGSVEIWLSESGDLMPIRIRLEDRNGHVLDQLIGSD